MATRRRLDVEMARRGLVGTREAAQREIAQGRVLVGGAVASKPARMVGPDEPVTLVGPPPRYVSRGGVKLEAALERFSIDPRGKRALDAGASTGGFTDCLLQHGAGGVVAVDVGHSQMHERIRADPRVEVVERTNVRDLGPDRLPEPLSLIVADLSFISLRSVAAVLAGPIASAGADIVTLVKPQFEAGRAEASRGKGIISDPGIWQRCLSEVASAFGAQGAAIMGVMPSPITGSSGNVEFLMWTRAHVTEPSSDNERSAGLIVGAVAEVGGN